MRGCWAVPVVSFGVMKCWALSSPETASTSPAIEAGRVAVCSGARATWPCGSVKLPKVTPKMALDLGLGSRHLDEATEAELHIDDLEAVGPEFLDEGLRLGGGGANSACAWDALR